MHYYSSNALLSCYIMCPSDYDSTDYANHSNMILQNDDYFVDFKVEVEFIMMIIVISWHLPLFMPSKTCFSVDNQITEFIVQQHEMQQCLVIWSGYIWYILIMSDKYQLDGINLQNFLITESLTLNYHIFSDWFNTWI